MVYQFQPAGADIPGTGDPDCDRSSGVPTGTARSTKVPARSGVQVASAVAPVSPREASTPASPRHEPADPDEPAFPPDPDEPAAPPDPDRPALPPDPDDPPVPSPPEPPEFPDPPEPAMPPEPEEPGVPPEPPRAELPPVPPGLPVDPAPPLPAPPLSSTVSPPAQRKRAKPIRIAARWMRTSDCMRSGGEREKLGAPQCLLTAPVNERAVPADFFQAVGALKAIVFRAHGGAAPRTGALRPPRARGIA